MRHVYFPTTAIVSLLYVMANGASAEIVVVGNEGIVGVSLYMGSKTTTSRAVVHSAGHGYRLAVQFLKDESFTPVRCSACCCVTPRLCRRRWPRRRCATGIIHWLSNSAAGCC
jgi:hypothetical protein